MTKLRLSIMGTRGKSSLVRVLHNFFYDNGYTVLSRETGLFPIVYHNDTVTFLERKRAVPFNRASEINVVMKRFGHQDYDVNIFENNAIRETYMRNFHQLVHPDITLITTISLDHILDQGTTLDEVSETFIKCIPDYSRAIFWSNHSIEVEAFRRVSEQMGMSDIDILFSPFRKRDEMIIDSLLKILPEMGIETSKTLRQPKKGGSIPSEIFANVEGRYFVNLGHINDVVHTSLAMDEVINSIRSPNVYIFFNFRPDRLERNMVFMDAFLPLFVGLIDGIIFRTEGLSFTNAFCTKYLKDTLFRDSAVAFYACRAVDDLVSQIILNIPKGSVIIMVGNTADEFGKTLIRDFGLFRDTYPILDDV